MRDAMERVTRRYALVLLLVLSACGGNSTGPSDVNLSGVWTFSESFSSQAPNQGISCNNTGTFTISHVGSAFNGSFSQQGLCTGPGGSLDNSGSGAISGGQISGSTVSFQVPFCQYQGRLGGSNSMTGSVSCSIQEQGITVNFAGTWQASR